MAEDKVPMPADGSQTERTKPDDIGELASRRDGQSAGGLPNVGESGGGAYPNPHTGKEGSSANEGSSGGPDTLMGHGGQADASYYGHDKLGDKGGETTGNAVAKDED